MHKSSEENGERVFLKQTKVKHWENCHQNQRNRLQFNRGLHALFIGRDLK